MRSSEYLKGRVDYFVLDNRIDFHKELISVLHKLNFNQNSLNEFDFDFTEVEGYKFAFFNNMRIHLIINSESISFILDTNESKERIIGCIEKYFQIF